MFSLTNWRVTLSPPVLNLHCLSLSIALCQQPLWKEPHLQHKITLALLRFLLVPHLQESCQIGLPRIPWKLAFLTSAHWLWVPTHCCLWSRVVSILRSATWYVVLADLRSDSGFLSHTAVEFCFSLSFKICKLKCWYFPWMVAVRVSSGPCCGNWAVL